MKLVAVSIAVLVTCLVGYLSFRLGLDGGLARSHYWQTLALKEESICIARGDLECLRANWKIRAAIAAEGARRGLTSPVHTGVEDELREYLAWYSIQSLTGEQGK